MASSSQTLKFEKATWDETNTSILLRLLVEEIDAGNRPSGHFTRQAWNRITQKFIEDSGCNFTQSQLKNKWDNLKKEFGLWEKLLLEETGLGYDYSSGRIDADPVWWRKKLQEKPEYRRFKTHGPVHLELQEKVFRGVVATGYMEYIPHCDPNLHLGTQNDVPDDLPLDSEVQVEDDAQNTDVAVEETAVPTQTPSRVSGRNGKGPKRKRTRTSSSKPTVGEVNENFMEVLNVMKAESANSIRMRGTENFISYGEAIEMLRSLPWIEIGSSYFTTGILLLEDEKKRIAFSHIVDLGEMVVKDWMDALKK